MNPSTVAIATHVTLLTSGAPSAIAVVEVSGPHAIEWVHRHWQPNQGSTALTIGCLRYGIFHADPAIDRAGESIVVYRQGEQRIELHCHGGSLAAQSILDAMKQDGAIERNSRDFLAATDDDPIQVAATEDLIQARTVKTAQILMDQRRGALRKAFQAIEAMLRMGAYHDAIEALNLLHRWSDIGLHLVLPWRIVLAGPPNVGKSSLLNRMLGYTRAIVHAEAGTTRDLLQESTSIDGWLVQLIDSAGVRSTSDTVEKQGVERTMNAIESADRVLLLVDPHQGWTPTHEQVWCERESRCILVRTKSDLADTIQSTIAFPSCCVSATTGDGMDQLMATIADSLVPFDVSRGQAIPFRETHVRWIEERLSFATQSTGA